MKLKTLLLTLFLFSSVYAVERENAYYPTGEIRKAQEYVDGVLSKVTNYFSSVYAVERECLLPNW